MAGYTFKVTISEKFYAILQERAERRGEDPEDNAALAADIAKVAEGRLKALHKHGAKVAAVKADPIAAVEKGITFEPRRPLLAPDAIDVDRLVALGIAPAPKANGAAPEKPAKARKANGRKAQMALKA